ncbi:MAG: phage portal protein [Lawsonella sp.]
MVKDFLVHGVQRIDAKQSRFRLRQDAYEGRHPLPFAPDGVNREYEALRRMSPVPLIRLAVRTSCQRLRAGGLRADLGDEFARGLWSVWEANNMGARQRIPYVDGLVHDCGIISVWPNSKDRGRPFIRPESPAQVHIEQDPADPFSSLYAVKTFVERVEGEDVHAAYVYTPDLIVKYTRGAKHSSNWVHKWESVNPLGAVPFVVFSPEIDAAGSGVSLVDALLPMQRAIDTMRFNLLLAAQFAAYRQRVFTGFDPHLTDEDGNPLYKRDEAGELVLDSAGVPIPVLADLRAGVDRALTFTDTDTKVYDLDESDLKNYVTAIDMLVSQFASIAQVPPQYLVGDFKNVSGDLMVATEATLRALVTDLQMGYGESIKDVMRLAHVARGGDLSDVDGLVVDWLDADPKSISQIASAAAQMIPNGAPLRMFLEQWPNATPQMVDRWISESDNAVSRALGGDFSAAMFGLKEPA